ncbi:ubiquitin-protein ligase E3B-like [Amphibalanus amphitrite]|uniref:ubiquitin-protein ligase E3B-like n=1 Tax=Amphibalanus amphitrite TaxID=1232801 RepID=UPI001C8FC3EA|nr:ubiquitin-protein ligase E3B-like [Amphibalanus amphitrite]XP_043191372.1 ubiquitin-protein ligase E3B-like [Amphibalanus amphitrite]
MFQKPDASKDAFLEQARAAREERHMQQRRERAAVRVQALVRGFLARRAARRDVTRRLEAVLQSAAGAEESPPLVAAQEVYRCVRDYLVITGGRDGQRFGQICRYLVHSMASDSLKLCYASVALNPQHAVGWIRQMRTILAQCLSRLETLRPETAGDAPTVTLYLHMLLTFTSTSSWRLLTNPSHEKLRPVMDKLCLALLQHASAAHLMRTLKEVLVRGLARSRPVLRHASLTACMTLALRPLVASQFSANDVSAYLISVLSVPGLVSHLQSTAPECLSAISTHGLLAKCTAHLLDQQALRIVFNTLEGNYALCLLANLVHLAYLQEPDTLASVLCPDLSLVLTRLLESLQKYVQNKRSNLSQWHPVLGWFSQPLDPRLTEALPAVRAQLQLLWSRPISAALFAGMERAPAPAPAPAPAGAAQPPPPDGRLAGWLRRALERGRPGAAAARRLGSAECARVALVCSLYQTALQTLTQLRSDILTSLCYGGSLLPDLWSLLRGLGPDCGLRQFVGLLGSPDGSAAPEFHVVSMFCDCMANYVVVLDDIEMYEEQKLFKLEDYVQISGFLNTFVYKIISNNLIDAKSLPTSSLFQSLHALLLLLYKRDCRRQFAPKNHWIIREIKISFLNDVEKNKKWALLLLQKVPHVLHHEERVYLFRQEVSKERLALGLTESPFTSPQSTLITIHRSRLLEDGYRQLATLSPQLLKGIVRVKFINEQGLDEAGIDQDGVFKEFLEETIRRVFDPSLSLFQTTSEQRLYPSPASSVHHDHLQLLEFVGKMLGKAVYEGIVVDVPFAPFFLSELLGHSHKNLYCSVDELPSLDPELYKNITYIKRYDGDVQDLGLTFSYDQDVMGQLVTHDLIPGGRVIPVTNENKIQYVYHLAHFRMQTQIKEQTAAFIRGFRALVRPEWLQMFSPPELQRLIAGDNVDLDVRELRKYTQYYGGFHDRHRVVVWFWDVLDKDFTQEEKKMFLKFVTSCSKPPLMGFAHLEPPFSIRCVEVGDDDDTGDTIGSMLRGFLSVRRRDPVTRLPTSSTCFNLLKLPNYQKKATLRDKLRYAIRNNTGFELS